VGQNIATKERAKERVMETDVVCGMKVDPNKAPAQSQYQGQLYYFCSTDCKAKFDANPQQYVKQELHAR
jgi:P-type Cu+ transporter